MGMTGKLSRFLGVAAVVLGFAPAYAQAQGTTISGQVTGTGGAPVVGASVSVPTLRVGGFSDDQGRYSFTVPASANGTTVTVVARRLGFSPSSAAVAVNGTPVSQNFSLSPTATELTGVVVTALGIARERSQLGTAVQQISSSDLNTTHDMNVLNQLSGKVSGVVMNQSGTQGGSTNIVIRGQNSITGNNQPLFIVDGVPVSNASHGSASYGGGLDVTASGGAGKDYGSAIDDINPEDVATVSVLKGPNAAALYGSRAANGVILITTKKGANTSGRVQTQVTSSLTFDTPSILPDYQNEYGQGAGGEFLFVNGKGGGVNDGLDQSFGPRLDGRTTGCIFVPGTHFKGENPFTDPHVYDNTVPCAQFNAPNGAPWVAHPDNVSSFFNTGKTLANTLAFSGGTDRAQARLSVGNQQVQGIIPNNTFRKFNSLLSGTLNVTDRLSASGDIQYINNDNHNRAGTGYNSGILEQFVWFGRQVDMNALRNQMGDAAGNLSNWNYNFHNNPFWLQYENPGEDVRDRITGNLSARYHLTDWLDATARTGSDIYRWQINQDYAQGNLVYANPSYAGAYTQFSEYSNANNSDVLLTANKHAGSHFQLNGTLGGARRYERYNNDQQRTSGIIVPGIYNSSNAGITPTLTSFVSRRQVNSLYGSAAATLNDWWTVEVTGRNDWSSTLPVGNNSYFYPSVNTSLVLSDAVPFLKSGPVSYVKVRGSLAQVGADADPYQLQTVYVGQPTKFGSLPQVTLDNSQKDPNLKPELTKSGEVGLELGFLDGRATLDMSYYGKSTTNQIVNLTVSPASGFQSQVANLGRIDNKGFEALLDLTPIRSDRGFQWNTTFNYSQNKSKVVSLAPGIDTYVIYSDWYQNLEARVGQPYGVIYGYKYARDDAGNLLLHDGLPYLGDQGVIGSVQPKWVGGWNNDFRFGPAQLSFLFDFHKGGKIFSVTNMWGDYTGIFKNSLKGREVDWNNPGLVVKGTDDVTGQPNTTRVTAEQYWESLYYNAEQYTYDDSFVKLRNLRFGVDLPGSFASRLHASSVNIALIGNNLWTSTKVPNIDPEFSYGTGNAQGFEFATIPNTKSIGFNLRITP
ncbi:MAG TPA: SusC/RagA family TonB-linked outer membrane protein [Gemmatimonadaceae bacterium]|jgi:TonB-linked SusC/RagA family outer membrane protein|nr:SusC/RagA family TonB-linked outer membrane protein [Gemmatimonadaceae bacterium]